MSTRFLTNAMDQIPFFLKISKVKKMVRKCREKKSKIAKGLLFGEFYRCAFCSEIICQQSLQSLQISRFKQIGSFFSNFITTHFLSPFEPKLEDLKTATFLSNL